MDFSIMKYYGRQASRCGYCKRKYSGIAHDNDNDNGVTRIKRGMHAYNVMPEDYQDLIDRGWRRSGHYCYKPEMKETCCPCYTIKCDALEFKLSKSHKKVIKRLNRFLRDGKKEKNEESATDNSSQGAVGGVSDPTADGEEPSGDGGGGIHDEPQEPDEAIPQINLQEVATDNPERHTKANKNSRNFDAPPPSDGNDKASGSGDDRLKISNESLMAPRKAKLIRLERRQEKLAAKGATASAPALDEKASKKKMPPKEKTLSEFLNDSRLDDKHKLNIVMVSTDNLPITTDALNLYRKYQTIVHNDEPERLTPTSLERFLYKSPVKLLLVDVKSQEFKDTLSSSYALYEKYQTRIHNDKPDNVEEYLEFLQKSPLQRVQTHDGPTMGYGSFHQQYWLDDKLIAVGVIDILPYCVSSVYFFYDPDYGFLSLGTYGSLREIELVQQLASKIPPLKYYYMGFYIHSCPKMRYKGKLVPSFLLCPETYTWNLLTDEIRDKLNQHKYQRLNPDVECKDVDEFVENDLDNVLLLLKEGRNKVIVSYHQYIQSFNIKSLDRILDIVRSRIYKEITGDDDDRDTIIEYGKLVGKTCAHRMIYLNF